MLQLQADNGYPKDLDAIMVKVKEQKYITVVSKKTSLLLSTFTWILLQDALFSLGQAEKNTRSLMEE